MFSSKIRGKKCCFRQIFFKSTVKQRFGENRHHSFVFYDRESHIPSQKELSDIPLKLKVSHKVDDIISHFLPKEYPTSVAIGYLKFAQGQLCSSIFGSAGGVLATQSLLYAVGLGAGSIPLAATVNWVLRDGLGQLGGVIFSSVAGGRFDADPKRWRFASVIMLECSALLELLTPLAPSYFLLVASIANIGKNISYLAASAGRAAIHKSFAINENLADVTAKTGSQTILSSTLGTALGISLAAFIGNEYLFTLTTFICLSSLSVLSNYYSLSHVTINTLSNVRLEWLFAHYLNIDKLLQNNDFREAVQSIINCSSTLHERELLSPQQVRSMERLLGVPSFKLPNLEIGADASKVFRNEQELQEVMRLYPANKFKFVISSYSKQFGDKRNSETFILFRENASLHDVVLGLTHAYIVRLLLLQEQNSKLNPLHDRNNKDFILRNDILDNAIHLATKEIFPSKSLSESFADKLVLSETSPWLASCGLLESRFARIN